MVPHSGKWSHRVAFLIASNSIAVVPQSRLYVNECSENLLASLYRVFSHIIRVLSWINRRVFRLGTGALSSESVPREISLRLEDDSIVGLACGSQHTILWTKEGLCYGFGSNAHSQLPINTNNDGYKQNQVCPCHLCSWFVLAYNTYIIRMGHSECFIPFGSHVRKPIFRPFPKHMCI